jgi:hypothetical protein
MHGLLTHEAAEGRRMIRATIAEMRAMADEILS